MLRFSIQSNSPDETFALGQKIGSMLTPGALLLLRGDLGAGKTLFTQGLALGAGVDENIPITSPTYTLMNIYNGRLPVYHFDLYRLDGGADIEELGFDEYFHGDGIAVVEWSERVPELISEGLNISFEYGCPVDDSGDSHRSGDTDYSFETRTITITIDKKNSQYKYLHDKLELA